MNFKLNLWICIGLTSFAKLLILPSAYGNESRLLFKADGQTLFRPTLITSSSKPNRLFHINNVGISEHQQLVSQALDLIEITGVQLEPTAAGLNVVLETADGPLPLPTPTAEGASLVIDIPNTVLLLPDERAFQADSPAEGIAAVTVTQQTADRVQVRIVGSEEAPIADVRSENSRLILSISTLPADTIRLVVTAEKTPEDPLDVPISLTVLTEEEIEDARIDSIADVAANTPNFFFTPGDRVFNFYSVRGLGNSNNVVARDAVGFYIDDVPFENVHQFFPSELFDIERIEVLRGPQSTLYGRNSQAGVVNIISRSPSEDPELRISALYGDFNERQLQFAVNDSLVPDTLAIRLAGVYSGIDGFTENTLLNDDAEEQSGLAGRVSLLWTPSEAWEVALNIAASRTQDDAIVIVPVDQDDPFEVARTDDGEFNLNANTQSLRVGYEGSGFRVTSITARSRTDYNNFSVDFGPIESDFDQEIISQELRFQSPLEADRFQWIVGGYFLNRDFRLGDRREFFEGTNIDFSDYDQRTYAGFAQIDYKPIEPLTLTAGLRYEYWQDELDRDASVFASEEPIDEVDLPILPLFPVSSDIDGDILLPRFAATYRINPNTMLYGSITRGYRPGTHNFAALTNEALIVDPERSWNYELGLKTSWLNDRLGVNLTGFYNDLTDYQVFVTEIDGTVSDVFNADARAIGAELEIRATPFDGFDITAGLGYTDAEFVDFTNPATNENFDGNRLLYAPDYTYNLAVQYRSPGGFLGRVELQGVGTIFFDEANEVKEDPFALVNARVGYEFNRTGIYLFSNNIFDTEYVTFLDAFGFATFGDRRTFGIEVRSRF